jgi:hypothetical protein
MFTSIFLLRLRVIIDDFDIVGVAPGPSKADTPLIINPNAHLSCPAPFQSFEPITGWIAQIFKRGRRIQLPEFAQRPILNVTGKLAA